MKQSTARAANSSYIKWQKAHWRKITGACKSHKKSLIKNLTISEFRNISAIGFTGIWRVTVIKEPGAKPFTFMFLSIFKLLLIRVFIYREQVNESMFDFIYFHKRLMIWGRKFSMSFQLK